MFSECYYFIFKKRKRIMLLYVPNFASDVSLYTFSYWKKRVRKKCTEDILEKNDSIKNQKTPTYTHKQMGGRGREGERERERERERGKKYKDPL